jgi:nucleotide-binding universal stress UspA family protein
MSQAGMSQAGMSQAERSGPALRWASAEAIVRGLALTLVHAWHEALDLSVELTADSLPGVPFPATSQVVQGEVATALLRQHPDLLVLGGRGGARRLSRNTRACLRRAGCPVVVVPDAERPVTRRVVVGVNGTAASLAALVWAANEALLQGAALAVVYAWQAHPTSVRQVLQPALAVQWQQGEAEDRLRRWVQPAVGQLEVELHAIHGGPLDGLLKQTANADLLVLGRGRASGFGRLLHGALSDDLSALAPCPTAVIPGLATSTAALV